MICVSRGDFDATSGHDCREDYFMRIETGKRFVHPNELDAYIFEKEIDIFVIELKPILKWML